MSGIEARAARAAKIAAAAVRGGHPVTIGPLTDMDALEKQFGIHAAAAASVPVPTVSRADDKAFLKNLDGIAAGRVRVGP